MADLTPSVGSFRILQYFAMPLLLPPAPPHTNSADMMRHHYGQNLQPDTPELRDFIAVQKMFFVATAPLDAGGHVNLSPKGLDCLRVLSEKCVAYLDLTGSGNETSAHTDENGRITLMFCAFEGPPMILRIYGKGRTVLPGSSEWPELSAKFELFPGTRQIIVTEIDQVMTSCGFAVPLYDFVGHRDTLIQYAEKKGDAGLMEYRRQKNVLSIDGLPTPLGKALARTD